MAIVTRYSDLPPPEQKAITSKSDSEHSRLCRKALSWLNNTIKCQIAVSEMSYGREIPDALGWRWDTSILVECKVTRADFLRDKKKAFRHQIGKGLGDYQRQSRLRSL